MTTGTGFRRILVALDASPGSLAALHAAVELAGRLHAELMGLFVEDAELLRAAEHPLGRHVSLPSGVGAPIRDAAIAAQLRTLAERAQAALRAALLRAGVSGSFRVARGGVVPEVLAAAREVDLLILGLAGRPLAATTRLGRTAGAAAERTAGPVLLLPQTGTLAGPIVVLVEASAGAERALETAARLAAAADVHEVSLLAVAATEADASARAQRAGEWLAAHGLGTGCRVFAPSQRAALGRALRGEGKGVLVVAADSPLVSERGLRAFLDETGRALLIAR